VHIYTWFTWPLETMQDFWGNTPLHLFMVCTAAAFSREPYPPTLRYRLAEVLLCLLRKGAQVDQLNYRGEAVPQVGSPFVQETLALATAALTGVANLEAAAQSEGDDDAVHTDTAQDKSLKPVSGAKLQMPVDTGSTCIQPFVNGLRESDTKGQAELPLGESSASLVTARAAADVDTTSQTGAGGGAGDAVFDANEEVQPDTAHALLKDEHHQHVVSSGMIPGGVDQWAAANDDDTQVRSADGGIVAASGAAANGDVRGIASKPGHEGKEVGGDAGASVEEMDGPANQSAVESAGAKAERVEAEVA
jgi:hypothetical protein